MLGSQPAVSKDEHDEHHDWPMYGRNLAHTFSSRSSAITERNVSSLKLRWTFATGDAVTASPAVVDGVVYVGAWDGFFYALDAETGALKWKFQLDCQSAVVPVPQVCGGPGPGIPTPARFQTPGGIAVSSAAIVDDRVYFGGGRTLYSLARHDGHLIWKHVVCGNPEDKNCNADLNDPLQILSSPAVAGRKLFVGATTGGVAFGIPYRGGFLAFDAQNGEQLWRFEVDPPTNSANRGCGNVWSSPAVDREQHLVIFGTSDCIEQPLPPYHGSVIALDTEAGSPRWVFRPREFDTHKCDFDFGASPNLITLDGRARVGIGGKDGTYYLLDRQTGEVIWSTRVVFGGGFGGFFGAAAVEGRRIYSATAFGDGNAQALAGLCDMFFHDENNPHVVDTFIQEPSMHFLDARTGMVVTEQQDSQSLGPTTLADGVVFSGFIGKSTADLPAVKAYRATNLAVLAVLPISVGGRPGMVSSAVVPVGRAVYFGSGNFFDGTGSGVHAYALPDRD
jgi:outer membrane protein assembly factor BamB